MKLKQIIKVNNKSKTFESMKKNFKYAILGAIALGGAVGFSACSSSDEIVDNPEYNLETNAVKTEFSLNIVSPESRTRMTATNTQQSGFLGIQDATLFSFNTTPAASVAPIAEGKFALGEITGITAAASSKVYTLYIPVGTNNFLFYGKATTAGQGAAQGYLESTVSTVQADAGTPAKTTDDITFNLKSIHAGATTFGTAQTTFLAYLNNILQASVAANTTTGVEAATWVGTQKLAADGTVQQKLDYKALSDAYKSFIKIGTSTIRQGSAFAILRNIQDLYLAMGRIKDNTTAPATVTALATAVQTAITNGLNTDGSDTSVGKIIINVADQGTTTTTDDVLSYDETNMTADVYNFPIAQGLPSGAACLKLSAAAVTPDALNYTTYDEFDWNNDGKNVLSNVAVNVTKIDYPAELIYFCKSPVITSNTNHVVTDYPVTVANWDADPVANTVGRWSTDWTKNSTVAKSTRAVAMQYNVQYGVGVLESTIKFAASTWDESTDTYTLTDNAKTVTDDEIEDQNIEFDADDFVWTGILIGGQPDQANWTLLTSNTANMNQVIYDNVINTTAITKTASATPTYTLVLDNLIGGGTEQTVTVAVEIKNNSGKDFYGLDGLIADGQTFYLLAELDPSSAAAGLMGTKPNGYPVPDTKRVFAQDYKTTANFTIPSTALKKAYSTIPDLRSTQMTFGLSVDLTWTAGLTYDVNLGQ